MDTKIHGAMSNALHLTAGDVAHTAHGRPLSTAVLNEIAALMVTELAEAGYAIVKVEPLIPTITVHDPLGAVSSSHTYGDRRQFEIAAARLAILAAISQARAEIVETVLA